MVPRSRSMQGQVASLQWHFWHATDGISERRGLAGSWKANVGIKNRKSGLYFPALDS